MFVPNKWLEQSQQSECSDKNHFFGSIFASGTVLIVRKILVGLIARLVFFVERLANGAIAWVAL